MTTADQSVPTPQDSATPNAPSPDSSTGPLRHALALIVYVVLTVALTWPLARHAGSKIAFYPKQTILAPYYHVYLVAWYHRVFDRGLTGYWDCNVFYPHPRVLTYYESLSAPAAMTWPVHLASDNFTLSYDLVVLSAFVLNGLGVYVLALQLGLSWRLGVLAGAAVAFCPYFFGEIYCAAMLLLYPVPFLLAALHRLTRRPTWLGVVLVGVCGIWLVLTCYQYTLFCSLFFVAWVLWFVRRFAWRRLWYKLLVVGAVCGAAVAPMLSTVKATHREMGFYHGPTLPMIWGQMLAPPTPNRFYHDLLGIEIREHREDLDPVVCFPGVTFSVLAAIGAWVALFGAAATDEDRRRRHAYRFCLLASIVGVALAMGLWIRFGPIRVPGPYALVFLTLSPFSSVRSVYRFYIFGQLFAAILAGVGLRRCLERIATAGPRYALSAAVVVLLLAESIWAPLPLEPLGGRPSDATPLYQRMAELDPNAPLIELPIPADIRRAPLDALYTVASAHTWQPLVNGFASYTPGVYEELREVMTEFPSFRTIRYLRALGVRYLIVRTPLMDKEAVGGIRAFPSLREIARDGKDVLYEVTETKRLSLNDRQGKTGFEIERNPKSKRKARGSVTFELDLREVVPVLPGDRGTRWTLTWRGSAGDVVMIRDVDVRDSHWLTHGKGITETVDLPAKRGTYTVTATDRRDGAELGTCTFEVQ